MVVMVTDMKIILLFWGFSGVLLHAADVEDVAAGPVFSCAGRTSGYYADVNSGCQKYHMCDVGGRLYSYECPNRTLFQQRVMICDHWFMVDCSLSQSYYSSNLLIGAKDKPFLTGYQEQRRKTPVRTTTPYPWTRSVTTSATIKQNDTQIIREPSNRLQFPTQPFEVRPSVVGNKESSTPIRHIIIPPEYSNNPFFRRLTTGSSVAPILITDKGYNVVLTSPIPPRKDQQNLFDTNRREEFASTWLTTLVSQTTTTPATLFDDFESNRFSSPSPLPNSRVSATASPLNSQNNFKTTQGHANQYTKDSPELRQLTNSETLTDDLGVSTMLSDDHNEDNTLELRFPDTRHMFYIADNPTRHAEMLNTNNETILTISLPATSNKHHGAMRFKDARNSKGRRDACPQCHPAFLLPDQCQPCVLIRR